MVFRFCLRFFLVLTLLADSLLAFPQAPRPAPGVATGRVVNFPGTRVFFTLPPGFTPAGGGFERDVQTGFTVMDLPGGAFSTNAARMTRANFEARGMRVFSFEERVVNGYSAKLVHVAVSPAVHQHLLTFGDATFSAMVTGLFPATDAAVGQRMRQALLTTTYRKRFPADPLAAAPFRLDERRSRFKFVKAAAGVFFYMLDGVEQQVNRNAPMLLVMALPGNGATAQATARSVVPGIEKNMSRRRVLTASGQRLNGNDAYQETATGVRDGQPCQVQVVVVRRGDQAVLVYGVAYEHMPATMAEMQKLAHTVSFK